MCIRRKLGKLLPYLLVLSALVGVWQREISAHAAERTETNFPFGDSYIEISKLYASDQEAFDEYGNSVAISENTVVVGAYAENNGAGAAYVYEIDVDGNWVETTKLMASDAQPSDYFSYRAVAINGDTIVVGSFRENGGAGDPLSNAGAAYVFERNQGGPENWGEVTKLTASDAQASDEFGSAVGISNDTIVVGAHLDNNVQGTDAGAIYVFERDQGGSGNWGEVKTLFASDGGAGAELGWSVSIHLDTIVAGAHEGDGGAGGAVSDSGLAFVFERDLGGPDNWGEAHC